MLRYCCKREEKYGHFFFNALTCLILRLERFWSFGENFVL